MEKFGRGAAGNAETMKSRQFIPLEFGQRRPFPGLRIIAARRGDEETKNIKRAIPRCFIVAVITIYNVGDVLGFFSLLIYPATYIHY